MKKINLTLAALLCMYGYAAAASDFPAANPKLEAAITQNVEESTSQQAAAGRPHDDAVFDMVLTVKSKLQTNNYAETFSKPCSAVLIDQNWLLASLYCRGVGPTASFYDHHGEISAGSKYVEYRKILKAAIRAKASHARDVIWPRDIFIDESANIILLRIDNTNLDLVDEVNTNGRKPASLLIPNEPSLVAKYAYEGYINRERFCNFGRCSDAVDVKCNGTACHQTGWELINGDAGDPLFVVSSRDKKSEFLFGFNTAEIIGHDPQSGSTYSTFTRPVYNRMLKIIRAHDPAAADRIHSRAKNEKILH